MHLIHGTPHNIPVVYILWSVAMVVDTARTPFNKRVKFKVLYDYNNLEALSAV